MITTEILYINAVFILYTCAYVSVKLNVYDAYTFPLAQIVFGSFVIFLENH